MSALEKRLEIYLQLLRTTTFKKICKIINFLKILKKLLLLTTTVTPQFLRRSYAKPPYTVFSPFINVLLKLSENYIAKVIKKQFKCNAEKNVGISTAKFNYQYIFTKCHPGKVRAERPAKMKFTQVQ